MNTYPKGRRLFADWRDFGREYAIIALGVLTARFAQQAVESFGWQQKVNAATDDMRQELGAGDAPQSYVRLMMNQCFNDRLEAVKEALNWAIARRLIT